jgi:hypothetical protein
MRKERYTNPQGYVVLHRRQRAYEATGNPNLNQCWVCQEYDAPTNLRRRSPTGGFEHRECRLRYRRDEWAREHPEAVPRGSYRNAKLRTA